MVKNYAFKCESGLSAPPFEKIRRSDNSDECVGDSEEHVQCQQTWGSCSRAISRNDKSLGDAMLMMWFITSPWERIILWVCGLGGALFHTRSPIVNGPWHSSLIFVGGGGEVTYRIAIVYGEKSFNKFCTIHWDISKSTEVQFKQNILICISHETKVKRTRTHEIQGLMPLSLASNYFDIFMVAENGLPGAGSPLHSPQTSVKRGECLTYQDDVRWSFIVSVPMYLCIFNIFVYIAAINIALVIQYATDPFHEELFVECWVFAYLLDTSRLTP